MATSKVVVEREATEPIGPLEGRYKFNESTGVWENAEGREKRGATITMVGDLMCGNSQLEKQVDENGEWNFNNSYTYIRDVFRKSDFAVANLETLLSAGWPYMADEAFIDNYNNCNAPARFLDAVRYGGFDAVMLANNHNCNGGKRALTDTIDQVNRYSFPNTGAFKAANDKRYFIADVNGIKVGFLAYMTRATGYNRKNKTWTKEEQDTMLNIFSYEKAVKDIKNLKADGAEFIIVYMHWGMKNFFNVTNKQRRDAEEVAKAGADFIVGANPHVCQKFEMIKVGMFRKVPCYYSMGNFVAEMKQVDENRDSIIVKIRLKRNIFGKVVLAENTYIPCRTYTRVKESHYAPLALSPSLNKGLKSIKYQQEFHDRIVCTIGDDVEVMDKYESWKSVSKKSRARKKQDNYIRGVMEQSGWDYDTAKEKMTYAMEHYYTCFELYWQYILWNEPEKFLGEIATKEQSEIIRVAYQQDKKTMHIIWNKEQFCKRFQKYVGRTCMATKNLRLEMFEKNFKPGKKIIYKPNTLSKGKGVLVWKLTEENIKEVFGKIKEQPIGVVENFVIQHPEMQKYSKKSVNTVRIVTVKTDKEDIGIEPNKVHFMYAAFRMGGGDKIVDNMHAGGLVAGVNIDTGIVETDGVDENGEMKAIHPDTGAVIKGFHIPFFQEAKQMIEEMYQGLVGMYGWDIAITEDGPIVIEGNTKPASALLQRPYIADGIGCRGVYDKFMPKNADELRKRIVFTYGNIKIPDDK